MEKNKKIVLIMIIIIMTVLVLNTTSNATDSIESTLYTIDETNELITRVVPGTKVEDFKSKITGPDAVKVYSNKNSSTEIITGIVKTGMAVKSGTKVYAISVIGDITGDGEVTLTDINKIINYYLNISINTVGDYELSDEYLAATNISQEDSAITITDIDNLIITVMHDDIPEQCKPKEKEKNPITVSSIKVKLGNAKNVYNIGETLDTTGLMVDVTYSNGDVKTITIGFSINPSNGTLLDTAGTQTVTVTYEGKTDTYEITVNQTPKTKTLSSITIKTNPSKMLYKVGENLDITGLTIEAKYSDNTTDIKSAGFTINPTNGTQLNTVGNQPIIIEYTENGITKTTTLNVTVEDNTQPTKQVIGVDINTYPTKTSYVVGEQLDLSGLVIKVTYYDGTSVDITEAFTANPTNGTKLDVVGTQVVKIIYGGVETKLYVDVTDNPPNIAIILNESNLEMIVGDTSTLSATVYPTTVQQSVNWSTDSANIATVDASTGEVTAVAKGIATITATSVADPNKMATCKVTVKEPTSSTIEVTGITLDQSKLNLQTGDEVTLTAEIEPANATDKKVTWSSNDTEVATVTVTVLGVKVKALKEGTATITAKSNSNNEIYASCTIKVTNSAISTHVATKISVSPETLYMKKRRKKRNISYSI